MPANRQSCNAWIANLRAPLVDLAGEVGGDIALPYVVRFGFDYLADSSVNPQVSFAILVSPGCVLRTFTILNTPQLIPTLYT